MIRNFFILLLCAFGCAQVKPLTGGEKDTIPPNLLNLYQKGFQQTQIVTTSFLSLTN